MTSADSDHTVRDGESRRPGSPGLRNLADAWLPTGQTAGKYNIDKATLRRRVTDIIQCLASHTSLDLSLIAAATCSIASPWINEHFMSLSLINKLSALIIYG